MVKQNQQIIILLKDKHLQLEFPIVLQRILGRHELVQVQGHYFATYFYDILE